MLEVVAAAGRQTELRRRRSVGWHVQLAPEPRNQVAAMVDVCVRDRDRIDGGPPLCFTKAREDAWTAIDEKPAAVVLEQVPRMRTSGVGPSGRAADDRELH